MPSVGEGYVGRSREDHRRKWCGGGGGGLGAVSLVGTVPWLGVFQFSGDQNLWSGEGET
jgi:hypothetical protein